MQPLKKKSMRKVSVSSSSSGSAISQKKGVFNKLANLKNNKVPQAKKPAAPIIETISSGSEVSLTDKKKKRDEKKERKEEVKKSAAKAK